MFEEDCQDSLIVEAINRRDTKAAQEIKESAQHIHQQRKAEICPVCDGEGLLYNIFADLHSICGTCNGSGKRPAVA